MPLLDLRLLDVQCQAVDLADSPSIARWHRSLWPDPVNAVLCAVHCVQAVALGSIRSETDLHRTQLLVGPKKRNHDARRVAKCEVKAKCGPSFLRYPARFALPVLKQPPVAAHDAWQTTFVSDLF